MKKVLTVLLGGVLALSLALNVFLLRRLSVKINELTPALASASELDEFRTQNQELQSKVTNPPDSVSLDIHELARLWNEMDQLRRKVREAAALRAQAVEATQLRTKLAEASKELARAETELAEALKRSPEEWQRMVQDEKSNKCASYLKQIGLGARLWADDHNHVFPPDFISMKQELSGPEILFCPADAAARPVFEWSQLNPSAISYRLLNPNGNPRVATDLLVTCPIHGHSVLSDGSVHRR